MANARCGLKTRGRNSAGRQSSHILRQGDGYKSANIIPLFIPKDDAFLAPKLSLNASERKALGNKLQAYRSRQKKYDEGSPLWLKQEAKIVQIREQLDNAGKQRKNTVNFFELELCLTDTPPSSIHHITFGDKVKGWLKKEFPDLEPVVGAVHKDQHSLHAHVMFAIPDGTTWRKFCDERYGGNRELAVSLTQSWHDHIGKTVKIEPLKVGEGKRWKKLKAYKAETGFTGKIGDANALPPQSHTDTESKADTKAEPKKEAAAKSIDEQIKTIAQPIVDRDALSKAIESLKKKTIDQSLK